MQTRPKDKYILCNKWQNLCIQVTWLLFTSKKQVTLNVNSFPRLSESRPEKCTLYSHPMEVMFSAGKGRWSNRVIFIDLGCGTLQESAFPKLLWEYFTLFPLSLGYKHWPWKKYEALYCGHSNEQWPFGGMDPSVVYGGV